MQEFDSDVYYRVLTVKESNGVINFFLHKLRHGQPLAENVKSGTVL